MYKSIILFVALVAFSLGSVSEVKANCGSFTTPCEGVATSDTFVPSIGTLSAYKKDGHRMVDVSFMWSDLSYLSWLKADSDHTLEPDVQFWGPNHYAQNIDLYYDDRGLGQISPGEPIVTFSMHSSVETSQGGLLYYADAVIDDDEPRYVTVGFVHAKYFEPETLYRTVSMTKSEYTGTTGFGEMALRFQRGKWVYEPDTFDIEDYIGLACKIDLGGYLLPNYLIAPLCVFSCCDDYPADAYVIGQSHGVFPPACRTWTFNYSTGKGTPVPCIEYTCDDGTDNDLDGVTDCDDSDCSDDPFCESPPDNPCATVATGNGYYCGQNEEMYQGTTNELYYCINGQESTPPPGDPPIGPCPDVCIVDDPFVDDYCYEPGCTQVCSPGQLQCDGNNVDICASDQCSFVFDHSCGANQICTNGVCVTQSDPAPDITSVNCTSLDRGDSATCTIYGTNLNAGSGSGTYIEHFNAQVVSWSSSQIVVTGDWPCIEAIGYKQVSHRNPDNQRDDEYSMVNVQMGDLRIDLVWQLTVHEGAVNVQMGANGCNFGPNVIMWVGGMTGLDTTSTLQAEDQVLATGNVVGITSQSPMEVCVAKGPGLSPGPDKVCWPGHIDIVP